MVNQDGSGVSATSRQQEMVFQRTWQPLPEMRQRIPFQQLIDNEFLEPEIAAQLLTRRLTRIVTAAYHHIPHYHKSFSAAGVMPSALRTPADLTKFPVLTRTDLVTAFDQLWSPELLNEGEKTIIVKTSGTTGTPARVRRTLSSLQTFPVLWQRQARWYRHDLRKRYARIRLPGALLTPGGKPNRDGATARSSTWIYSGRYFRTGDELHFNSTNSREALLHWLRTHQPAYLMTFPATMEELALLSDADGIPGLEGLISVSATLTRAMRRRVKERLGVPVYRNYGLNEIGLVAVTCEAGRYHTHIEHAHVEVVDEYGQHVAPGQSGRLLVTSLAREAMPLIRYDTGDIAIAAEQSCACGRTLPGFVDVLGRYRQFANTPEGTRPRVNGLVDVISEMPEMCFENLRQYQIHQDRNGGFELRVCVAGPLHPQFAQQLRAGWGRLNAAGDEWPLTIVEVDRIEPAPSGKVLDFVSDLADLDDDFAAA